MRVGGAARRTRVTSFLPKKKRSCVVRLCRVSVQWPSSQYTATCSAIFQSKNRLTHTPFLCQELARPTLKLYHPLALCMFCDRIRTCYRVNFVSWLVPYVLSFVIIAIWTPLLSRHLNYPGLQQTIGARHHGPVSGIIYIAWSVSGWILLNSEYRRWGLKIGIGKC
jgi:hypothetical protein